MREIAKIILDLPLFLSRCLAVLVGNCDSRIASLLRRGLYRTCCAIDTNVVIKNRSNFSAGSGSALYHGTYIHNREGLFRIGENSHLGAYCFVNACQGSVVIGDNVAIGPGAKIIAYSNHFERGKKVTESRKVSEIRIGNNVFIGANCTILPESRIGDNVVVAAGAVVRGVLEADSVYGGVPCRLIRKGWYG